VKITSYKTKDFGYIVIDNLFPDNELNDIWNELIHLDFIMNLQSVKNIRREDGALELLSGDGLTLDNVYMDRDYSAILKYNRRLWSDEVIEAFCSAHPANVHYVLCNLDSTFINRYTDSQGYKPHRDVSSFSSNTVFLKGDVVGGEFIFSEYDIEIECKNNQCIIFPSWVLHGAKEIKTKEGARYSMAMFSSQTLGANK
tara:strand:+ start:485 stop:1081 length:597 start_codon:yes stop_codon:yes gene_type:complete